MKTTLIIMAAGIGSRFGTGIKQLAKMGRCGEIIMDYSVYDAKAAGFDKVVFVIRRAIEGEFLEVIGNRISKQIECEYVFQELDALPAGYTVPAGRTKPWGTGQAILCCRNVVKEPCLIINADDYYGKQSFRMMHSFLVENQPGEKMTLGMPGYILKNTLSENGGVTRGVCRIEDGMLRKLEETHNIRLDENGSLTCTELEVQKWLTPDAKVSMNMWACYPDFIDYLEAGFTRFLSDLDSEDTCSEYLLPNIVDGLINRGEADVRVRDTDDRWLGITYKEDIALAQSSFARMSEAGIYPEKLW